MAAAGRYCTVVGWAGQDARLVQASAAAAEQQVLLLAVAGKMGASAVFAAVVATSADASAAGVVGAEG